MQIMPYAKHELFPEDFDAMTRAAHSGFLTKGPAVEGFENDLQAFTGFKHAVAVSSGGAALHAAMHAIGIRKGNVVCPSLTFTATAACVEMCGATAVFADIEHDTLCIDPESVRKAIAQYNAKAIIAMDYAGAPCDIVYLRKICDFYKIPLILDACHSFGGDWLQIADIACVSFHPAKLITTGEGGAMFTNNTDYYKRAMSFRDHGITVPVDKRVGANYQINEIGHNYRITDMQAALGSSQLGHAKDFLAIRKKLAKNYLKLFQNSPTIKPIAWSNESTNHIFVVDFHDSIVSRDTAYAEMRNMGFGVAMHYPPLHLMDAYPQAIGYGQARPLPVTEQKAKSIMTLPLFTTMTEDDQVRVVQALAEATRSIHHWNTGPRRIGNSFPSLPQ